MRKQGFHAAFSGTALLCTISILIVLVAFVFLLSGCSEKWLKEAEGSGQGKQDFVPSTPEQKSCISSGGEWKSFPNTCAGSCEYRQSLKIGKSLICGQAITESCECGNGKCWNGADCENM